MLEENHPERMHIGARINARCTCCGGRSIQVTEEFIGTRHYEIQTGKVITVTLVQVLEATGRIFGRCRQCAHDRAFRKNPLAP